LTTFIDHRHKLHHSLRLTRLLKLDFVLQIRFDRASTVSLAHQVLYSRRIRRSITCRYRQKGARRRPLNITDGKTIVGITIMQGELKLRTSRRVFDQPHTLKDVCGLTRPFTSNLTYSLVKANLQNEVKLEQSSEAE